MYYKSPVYRSFYVVILAALGVLSVLSLLPMIHVLAVSLSGKSATAANLVTFWPIDFTWDAYVKTLNNENFLRSLWNTLVRVLLGVSIGMFLTVTAAYPLSRDRRFFPKQGYYTWLFVITLLFNGGMVPNYILIQKLDLMNTIWALVLPMAVNAYTILLMLNFYRTLPKELEEAALIDGAGQWKALFLVYIPISLPAVTTLSLITIVYHWNEWFFGMIYMKEAKWPLATLMQSIIVQIDITKMGLNTSQMANISDRTVKAAQILIGALPILVLYPFLQRFFVKGMVLGAVKE